MPGPEIEIRVSTEDDPTPLVRALRRDLVRRLTDPRFAELTRRLRGTVAVAVEHTPEAATLELDGSIAIAHGGSARAEVTATIDRAGRLDGSRIDGEDAHPELAGWLGALVAPEPGSWREAAARFWAALEPSRGAPGALLVVNLETGERERFGSAPRAYEIHGETAALLRVLEGRGSLIEEAFERRIFIRGSFPEISVLTGAGFRIRMEEGSGDA